MIALWLLGAHLVGDFVLQSRVHVLTKLEDPVQRTAHVAWYTLPFVFVAAWYSPGWWQGAAFVACLFVLHWLTDSRRFHSNVGDIIAWRLSLHADPVGCKKVWLDHALERADTSVRAVDVDDRAVRWPPPNPWPALPLMIDQTLHVLQLALLGSLFLT